MEREGPFSCNIDTFHDLPCQVASSHVILLHALQQSSTLCHMPEPRHYVTMSASGGVGLMSCLAHSPVPTPTGGVNA